MSHLYDKVKRSLIRFNPELPDIMAAVGNDDIIIAGGAIRSIYSGDSIKDIDFYITDNVHEYAVDEVLKSYGFESVCTTDNAITYKHNGKTYQLITKLRFEKGKELELLKQFDFTATMASFSFAGEPKAVEEFLIDVAARELRLPLKNAVPLKYPIATLVRTIKYQKYGYKINPITLVRISLAIHALEIKTYGDMKEQLQGIDTSIFNAILDGKDDSITFELNEFIVELENYFDNLLK